MTVTASACKNAIDIFQWGRGKQNEVNMKINAWNELVTAIQEARQHGDNLEVAFIILSAVTIVIGSILTALFLIGVFVSPFLGW